MRASSAHLAATPIELGTLVFPQTGLLIARTRLAFIHLRNLLTFAKRDRDGRVDGYVGGFLPEEVVLVFFRRGEAVSAATLGAGGRGVLNVATAVRRMEAELERGELVYASAPLEQLAWMYQSCAAPAVPRKVDLKRPAALFPALAAEQFSGVIEFISGGRVSYLRFEDGRFRGGYFADRPSGVAVPSYLESLFLPGPDGAAPPIAAATYAPIEALPEQAAPALIGTYQDLYRRIVAAVDQEIPGEGESRAARARGRIVTSHPAVAVIAGAGDDATHQVVTPDALTKALASWATNLLEEVEVISPGGAANAVRGATQEQRYILQSAGFYDLIPWRIAW